MEITEDLIIEQQKSEIESIAEGRKHCSGSL